MSEPTVDEYYLRQGRELVDMLYDKNYLDNTTSREGLRELDEYLGFIIQSHSESAARLAVLSRKLKS